MKTKTQEEAPQQPQISPVDALAQQIVSFGEKKLAEEVLTALAQDASTFAELASMTRSFAMVGAYEKAMEYGDKALTQNVDDQTMINMKANMVNIYRRANHPEKALATILEYNLEKADVLFKIEKAGALYEVGKIADCQNILESIDVEQLDEYNRAKVRRDLGNCYLWSGKFSDGYQRIVIHGSEVSTIESRGARQFHNRKELQLPFWEGTPGCKKLIIYAEAGLGDEILNIRFMNLLRQRNIEAVWFGVWHKNAGNNGRFGAMEVFKNSNFNVIDDLRQLPNIQEYMWTYSQYLPIYLGLDDEDLWFGPYLNAIKVNLPDNGKKKIGLRWAGNPVPEYRNYPLKKLHAAIGNIDAEFYSLQRDFGVEETSDFPGIIDLSKKLDSFVDTCNYIQSMDVIVTSCTSIAHAAAALGKKTYVLIPMSAYYPWCHQGDKSPWYGDNVVELRQKKPRSWDEPLAELKVLLQQEVTKG
jgi:hypothetical protein